MLSQEMLTSIITRLKIYDLSTIYFNVLSDFMYFNTNLTDTQMYGKKTDVYANQLRSRPNIFFFVMYIFSFSLCNS